MANKIQVRRDMAICWTSTMILDQGEIGFEIDTGKFKIGDGISQWSALTYFTPGGAGGGVVDVQALSAAGLATQSYVDSVTSSTLQTLQSEFVTLDTRTTGSYTNLVSLISSATGTIATHLSTLEARFTSLSTGTGATVSYVDTAIANSTGAIASRVSTLEASFSSIGTGTSNVVSGASIQYVDTAIANSTASIASSVQTLQTNFTDLTTQMTNKANYSDVVTLVTNSTASLATRVIALETGSSGPAATTGATVAYVDSAISNATGGYASSIQTLNTNYTSLTGQLSTKANYTDVVSLISNSTSSIASSVQTLSSTVGGYSSTITSLTNSVNGVTSQWGVAIDNNNHVSGVKLLSGQGGTSAFIVNADTFQISGTGITPVTPFIVDTVNNTIKMNAALVTFSGTLQSDNYAAGSAGWIVNKNGTAEFNNGTFRGDLLVGTPPVISGTTIDSGSGARISSNGDFAMGTPSSNITHVGGVFAINGDVIGTGNIMSNAVTSSMTATTHGGGNYSNTVNAAFPATGGPITIVISGYGVGYLTNDGSSQAIVHSAVVYRNGTQIYTQGEYAVVVADNQGVSLTGVFVDRDYPANTTVNYQIVYTADKVWAGAASITISLQENKR